MNNDLLKVLLKRILSSLVVMFLLISFMFVLLRLAPGDPSDKFISPQMSPELATKVKESFNLNASVAAQYESFLINVVQGDLGISYSYRMPVISVIGEYLPFTIIFALLSFIFQLTLAFFLALLSVRKLDGFVDRTISKLSLVVYAIPSFVIGISLILVFSVYFRIFPSSGLASFDSASFSFFQKLGDYAGHMVLPLITLSLGGTAVFYKYLRDNIVEIYNKPFVLNLRANGVSERKITIRHIIPNAIGPLISVAGVELGVLFGGALITEVIFSLPGMGRLTMNAILSRDYPLVIGCTFIAGMLVIISNFAADLLKAKIDKRLIKDMLN
jgi:peptide/nickel transport system permease protein